MQFAVELIEGKQRSDSTHVLAAIRNLNRLETVAETLRAALNAVATVAPEWLRSWGTHEWFERYGRALEEYRLPKGVTARYKLAETIGNEFIVGCGVWSHDTKNKKDLLHCPNVGLWKELLVGLTGVAD